jgi:hypothetical protein
MGLKGRESWQIEHYGASQPEIRHAVGEGVMVGSMYLPSVTELFLAQPSMYLTWRGDKMQLGAEADPLRRL